MKEYILATIRHGLTIAGGALVTKGIADAGAVQEILGGVMALLGLVASFIGKRNAARNKA